MPPVSLRAVPLDPKDYNQVPSPAERLARFALEVDPAARTVTWTPDTKGGASTTYPLGLGTPGAAAGLRRVHYRSFPPILLTRASYAGKLLLVDADGGVLAASKPLLWPVFVRVFPAQDVSAEGFTTRDEDFATTYRLNKAHPGAARMWPLTSSYWSFLACALLFAVVVVAVALGIAAAT